MEKVFLNGDDLQQFLLYWHGYGFSEEWAQRFRVQHPKFQKEGAVEVQVAEEYAGKTILTVRKAITSLSPEGLVIQPLINAGDIGLDRLVPKLYFSFSGQGDYWGDKISKFYPEENYPYLRITGVQI